MSARSILAALRSASDIQNGPWLIDAGCSTKLTTPPNDTASLNVCRLCTSRMSSLSILYTVFQPVDQSINLSINQSTNQRLNQSINQSIQGLFKRVNSLGQLTSHSLRLIDLVLAKGETKVSWLLSFHSLIRQCFNILIRHCNPSRIRNIKIERSKQLQGGAKTGPNCAMKF